MEKKLVSVLICTRNRGTAVSRCLDSLSRQDYPAASLDVTAVDDASSDGSAEHLRAALRRLSAAGFAGASLFESAENGQIAAGRAFLGERVPQGAEYVLFLDDDAELPPNAVAAMAAFLRDNPGAGAVGPRIAALSSPAVTAHRANFISWLGRYYEKDASEPLECDWLNSTCLMVRAEALRGTGGFYPGYYTAHEEVDFCLRLRASGWQTVYLPSVTVLHDIVPGGTKRDRLYYLYRNKILMFRRNFALPRRVAADLLVLLFGLPKYILESLRASGGAEIPVILRAVWHGLSGREGKGPEN